MLLLIQGIFKTKYGASLCNAHWNHLLSLAVMLFPQHATVSNKTLATCAEHSKGHYVDLEKKFKHTR